MIAVANRIYVNSNFTKDFEERFKTRAGLVDGIPGFIFNQVLRPTQEVDPYIVLTFWETYEHFQNWVKSDEFKQGHTRSGSLPKAAFDKKNKVEVHQIILDSRNSELEADESLKLEMAHG